MGQLADDIITGLSCTECGTYFKEAHGYPVLCKECFEEIEQDEECFLPKATKKEL
jgi:hypothetical protein